MRSKSKAWKLTLAKNVEGPSWQCRVFEGDGLWQGLGLLIHRIVLLPAVDSGAAPPTALRVR
jgi:hypothetical protein